MTVTKKAVSIGNLPKNDVSKDLKKGGSLKQVTEIKRIVVKTRVSFENGAGTDNDVFIEFNRSKYLLDTLHINDFERGDERSYTITLNSPVSLIELDSVSIMKEPRSDDLHMYSVEVYDADSGALLAKSMNDFILTKHKLSENLLISKPKAPTEETIRYNGLYMVYKTAPTRDTSTLQIEALHFHKPVVLASVVGSASATLGPVGKHAYGVTYIPLFFEYTGECSLHYRFEQFNTLYDVTFYTLDGFKFYKRAENLWPGNQSPITFIGPIMEDTKTQKLAVIIKTANVQYAGVDGKVTFETCFKDGSVNSKVIDAGFINDFERNDFDVCVVEFSSPIDTRNISKFNLKVNPNVRSDRWAIDFVSVIDLESKETLAYYKGNGPTLLQKGGSLSINR